MQEVQLILFDDLKHRYRMNMDIYSLIMAWGLDLGESIELVKKVMKTLVYEDYLEDMNSLLEWATPGVGMDISEGIDNDEEEETEKCIPFVKWPE